MTEVALFVSVPIAAFRAPYAREYLETLPCPPPSTVYGMLLSLVGEEDRWSHLGAELAIAMLSEPRVSRVLRTSWRIKSNAPPGTGNNKHPDYQELLTDVRLAVWVRDGDDKAAGAPLAERVRAVVDREIIPHRFGGLALGESTHLVDEVRRLRADDAAQTRILRLDARGDLALPVWVDHVGSAGTRWAQYRFGEMDIGESPPPEAWTAIIPPGA